MQGADHPINRLLNRHFFWVALIGATALILRVAHLYDSTSSPLFDAPVADAATYVEDALRLAAGNWAGGPGPFWQPPLYPYFLGLQFWIWGEDYLAPRLVQALLGTGVCILLYYLGRAVFPVSVARGAGLAAACYGPLIYFGGELLPTIAAIFLSLLFLLSLLRPPCSHPWDWLLSGFLLGLSALAVANILLLLPFLLLWFRANARPNWVAPWLFVLVGCGLTIAPVSARNFTVGQDHVLLSSNAGINFYIGNNPEYERTVGIRPGYEWAKLVEIPETEAGIERPSARSRHFFAKSLKFMAQQPMQYLALSMRKLYLFWHGDEIRRNLDPYFARNDSVVLRTLMWKGGLAFPFGIVAPLALIGAFCFWRSSAASTPEGGLLLLFLLAYTLSVTAFFVTSRYRLPALPVMLLFAGSGVRQILVQRGNERKRLLTALVILLVSSNAGAGQMDMAGGGFERYAMGSAYEKKGMQANAVREYKAALVGTPGYRESMLRLAGVYVDRKQYDDAIALYGAFLERYPETPAVHFMLTNAHLAAGNYREAVAGYEALVPTRPEWAQLRGRLAYAYLMDAQPGRAIQEYRRTLDLRPDSSMVRYQLARLYEDQDSLVAATSQLSMLVQTEPANAVLRNRLADVLIRLAGAEGGEYSVGLARNRQTQEAETHLRRAIELDPNNAAPHWSLAMMLARQARYLEAQGHYERIAELEPDNYLVFFCLANVGKRTGQPAQAEEYMSRYRKAEAEQRLQRRARKEAEARLEEIFGIGGTGRGVAR